MTRLPLQHFRRAVAHLAGTPETHALAFAGTGITEAEVARPDFDLTPEILWAITANLRGALGPAWYLGLPALWGLEVQGELEGAMRFAPNVETMLQTAARFGTARWPLARWHLSIGKTHAVMSTTRIGEVPALDWHMLCALIALNYLTVLRAAFPMLLDHLRLEIEGPQLISDDEVKAVFGVPVQWNADVFHSRLPCRLLEIPSSLADPRGYAAMIAALKTQGAALDAPDYWNPRVSNLLSGYRGGRLHREAIADRLGLSVRTLERHLEREGTTLRQLRDKAAQAAFRELACRSGLGLAGIAEQLGYCDESALSRATKRWYGTSAAEARRRLRKAKLAGNDLVTPTGIEPVFQP